MASIEEAIRRLIYQYVVQGADKVVQTQQAVAASTTTTDKAALSLEKSFGNLERRYISSVRSQQDYQKVQERVNAAVEQNPALQERANAVLAAAQAQYGQATNAQKALAVATSGVNAQLVAMSAGAGPVGTFLAALGPWGFAASVGLGAVSAVFNRIVEGAERIGDKSIELKKFSDVTGLSVTEIKGLTKAGAELGVSSDDITTSVERFSVGLFEARKGSGALFDQVNKINPALARQLAEATSTAQGWDVLAQAIKGATDAAQRIVLARAAFGRGNIETGLVAAATVDKGGVAAMGDQIAKNTGLTKEWVDETARLRKENIELEKTTKAAMDAAFALPVLQRQNEYLKTLKEIADLTIKGGGFKAPGAEDFGAPFADFLSPSVAPLSKRGPSEGAMQAREEAAAQREVTKAIEDANKAREYAVSVDKMLLTIAQDTAEAEKRKAAIFAENAAAYQNVSATTAQILAQQKDQLAVASAVTGVAKINAQYEATINAERAKGKSLTDAMAIAEGQRRNTLAQINAAAQEHLAALRDQYAVASAVTGVQQIQAQAQATYNSLIRQGVNETTAYATVQWQAANARAAANADAERSLKTLQLENQTIHATSDVEKERIASRITYNKLVDQGVDSMLAEQVAAQQLKNAVDARLERESEAARAKETADAEREAADAARDRASATRAAAVEMERQAAAAAEIARQNAIIVEQGKFVAFAWRDANDSMIRMTTSMWTRANGSVSNFNPAGYTSTMTTPAGTRAMALYGEGGFDTNTGAPNAQGLANLANSMMLGGSGLGRGGEGITGTIEKLLTGSGGVAGGTFGSGGLDAATLQTVQRLTNLLPKEQQGSVIQRQIGILQSQPQNIETMEAIKTLTDSLDQLRNSTESNTQATQAMTDVLSPYYASDPRTSKLGFRTYAAGGIADSPQIAMYGEGSTPEAFVPVPSGRIPVELKTPANSNRPIQVTINVQGNADENTVAALKRTAFQQAQSMRRALG